MKSILVVVGDEIVREKVCSRLSTYRTHTAGSGRVALEISRLVKPDLILLDSDLPGMDGFSALDQLQSHPLLQHIPVILFTHDNSPETQAKGLKSGAVDFICTLQNGLPDWEILLHRVDQHLRLGEYRVSLEHSVREMEDNIGLCFAELIECKDLNYSGHVMRTERYAEFLALSLYGAEAFPSELSLSFIETLKRAVPFHDIGKICISEEILLKPGRLTDEELKTVWTHTVIGAKILNDIHDRLPGKPYFKMASLIARGHHERFDGKGYPDGFSGKDIPLCCRIVSVVNVYDACVTERVYHPPMTHEDACAEILKGRGSEFDPRIVDVFLQHNNAFARLGEELRSLSKQIEPLSPQEIPAELQVGYQ
jgi:putative two-component system response regulator